MHRRLKVTVETHDTHFVSTIIWLLLQLLDRKKINDKYLSNTNVGGVRNTKFDDTAHPTVGHTLYNMQNDSILPVLLSIPFQ